MKNIGKPDAGKLHVRFDEGGLGETCSLLYLMFLLTLDRRQVKNFPIGSLFRLKFRHVIWNCIDSTRRRVYFPFTPKSKFLSLLSLPWTAMNYIILILMTLLFTSLPAAASEITDLADCTKKVFSEINRTKKWTDKPLDGCKGRVAVEKRPDGVFVAAWSVARAEGGWIMTAFSGAMGYAEIADKKALALAAKDITSRAVRLERCLDSIMSTNDPLECRDRSTKVYRVSEEIGTEIRRLVWLDDAGRHAVIEYVSGTTSVATMQPVELLSGGSSSP